MENLEERFKKAAISVKSKTNLSNDQLLKLYALYKQSTEGDNSHVEPSNPFDFIGKAKHSAWLQLKGKGKEEAMLEYVEYSFFL